MYKAKNILIILGVYHKHTFKMLSLQNCIEFIRYIRTRAQWSSTKSPDGSISMEDIENFSGEFIRQHK